MSKLSVEEMHKKHQMLWDYIVNWTQSNMELGMPRSENRADNLHYEAAKITDCPDGHTCWACLCARDRAEMSKYLGVPCDLCPISWPNDNVCHLDRSLYSRWHRAVNRGDVYVAIELSKAIRDIRWRYM